MENFDGGLQFLKQKIFEQDDCACFIDRERYLVQAERETTPVQRQKPDFYARLLTGMLDHASVPVEPEDIFVGRMAEEISPEYPAPSSLLYSTGHMSFDYARILKEGLSGILQQIKRQAAVFCDRESREYAQNAQIVVEGIQRFALRYADAARAVGKFRAAEALTRVPYASAYDLFSALQGIWILHMVASCYVGSRDYAFGRTDEILLPYYEKSLAAGETEEELEQQLAAFLVKPNEICGRCTHNYKTKSVPSLASKQYINIGGEEPNVVSFAILRAQQRVNLAQPEVTVLLDETADPAFTRLVFETLAVVTDKMNVYNYPMVRDMLLKKGLPAPLAKNFTYSACCTLDLNYHNIREEYYIPSVQLFCQTLRQREYSDLAELVEAFTTALERNLQEYLDATPPVLSGEKGETDNRRAFVLDGLLIGPCADRCRYPLRGGLVVHLHNLFFSGIATVADSLAAIDTQVFREKTLSYPELLQALDADFENTPRLLQLLQKQPKFGNDLSVDGYAALAGKAFLTAIKRVEENLTVLPFQQRVLIPSFYSLERDNTWAEQIPATPDGRRSGQPYSENQSPSYGADRQGITALLNSVAKLPFAGTGAGGLNLTFGAPQTAAILQALVSGYFRQGGLHVGVSVIQRQQLEDAVLHPEKYPTLTVRLYGFSEYFINLPPWQQQAVLNRTVN